MTMNRIVLICVIGLLVVTMAACASGSSKKSSSNASASPSASASSSKLVGPDALANGANLKKGMTAAEFSQAYAAASKLMAPYAGLSLEKKIESVAKRLYQYKGDKGIQYSDTAPHYNDVYGFFINGVSSCAGATRSVGLCLNILGISYEHMNENQWSHQWCRIKVGRKDWLCDVYQPRYGPEEKPYWAITVTSPAGSRVEWTIPNFGW